MLPWIHLAQSCPGKFSLTVYISVEIFFHRYSHSQLLCPLNSWLKGHFWNNHLTQDRNLCLSSSILELQICFIPVYIFFFHITYPFLKCYTNLIINFSVMSDFAIHRLQPTRLPCPWTSPGKNAGVGSHFLLQGIFLTQVSCIAGRFFTSWTTR